jgi:antitoxin VapB
MKTARIFTNGRSQAVRLPKEFRFSGDEVYINKVQGIVMLIPKDDPWTSLINSLEHFSEDFMEQREQPVPQKREDV